MPTGSRQDPYCGYNFVVEINGLQAGGFQEVSGLQAEIEVQEYREGGRNDHMHKFAGPLKYPTNLVLKRGFGDQRELFNWYWDVMHGIVNRKNLSVVLLDSSGAETHRWNFKHAYPVKWVGPEFRAAASDVAVESLELVHNGLSKA